MSRKVVETLVCDRCGFEYPTVTGEGDTTQDLAYMFMRNGGGSRHSDMAQDLCVNCTQSFKAWWRNGKTN